MQIPSWLQSSADPEKVSLTVTSIGNSIAGIIMFLGVIGIVDPAIAGQTWGNFVSSVITAIPAGYAVWHCGMAVWGIMRKVGMRALSFMSKPAVWHCGMAVWGIMRKVGMRALSFMSKPAV